MRKESNGHSGLCLTALPQRLMSRVSVLNKFMKTILICDDSAFMRNILATTLRNASYNIIGEAENGVEAVAMYKELHPDVVTMDITMPEMDGIEAVKHIKAYDPDAKVIMCSAMGQQAMVIEAIQAGAKDFIVKPFQNEKVLSSIEKAIQV